MKQIKVMVVDDSAFMRVVIKDLLESDPEIEVVGTAKNGQDALVKLQENKPDIITLDVEMPVLDGIETLKQLNLEKIKIPTIMLSSTTKVGAENTIKALELGAFDFITKPSGSISLDIHKVKDKLLATIKSAIENNALDSSLSRPHSEAQNIKKQQGLREKPEPESSPVILNRPSSINEDSHHRKKDRVIEKALASSDLEKERKKEPSKLKQIILVGTSTGGPKALQQLLTQLPRQEEAAILIVQHMPPTFTNSLAKRLTQLTPHDVVEAQHDQNIVAGQAYIAPGGYHMKLKQKGKNIFIALNKEAPRGGHRPSVDVMIESSVDIKGYQFISVIMTGMGKDGLAGTKLFKERKSGYTIAEDRSTCVVYGMPRAIVEADLADEVLPLHHISTAIERLIKS